MAASGTTRTATERIRDERVFMTSHDGNVPSNARPTAVVGRHLTALVPPGLHRLDMTLISDPSTVRALDELRGVVATPGAHGAADDRGGGRSGGGPAAASRGGPGFARRPRSPLDAPRLVSAVDLVGRSWWIPAEAVWSDADGDAPAPASVGDRPGHRPQPGGRHARRPERPARLGGRRWLGTWAASCPSSTASASATADGAVVYDGRLGHDVPTVVVVTGLRRPGGPVRRSPRPTTGRCSATTAASATPASWTCSARCSPVAGLDVVAVDLGTPVFNRVGGAASAGPARWSRLTTQYGRGTPIR